MPETSKPPQGIPLLLLDGLQGADIDTRELLTQLPPDATILRLSDITSPSSRQGQLPWQEWSRAVDVMAESIPRASSGQTHVYVAGRAPLPLFAYLGLRLDRAAQVSVLNKHDGRWDLVSPTSTDAAPVFFTSTSILPSTEIGGKLALFVSTEPLLPLTEILAYMRVRKLEIAGIAELGTNGQRVPLTAETADAAVSELDAMLRRLQAEFPRCSGIVVFIAGPIQLATFVGRVIDPHFFATIEFPVFTAGRYAPAIEINNTAVAAPRHSAATGDRITQLRIEGLRTIEHLVLDVDRLCVLIGENGAGKSSILEACELLRRAAGPDFMAEFNGIHGGMFALLRDGASVMTLGVRVESSTDAPIEYEFTLAPKGVGTVVLRERVDVGPYPNKNEPLHVLDREAERTWVYSPIGEGRREAISVEPTRLVLGSSGLFSPHPALSRLRTALAGIEVHLGFEVLPLWAARAFKRRSDARGSILLEPAKRLSPLGGNLANVWYTLRNEFSDEHWQDTLMDVRMGLGPGVTGVNTRADAGGGALALTLTLAGRDEPLPASALSDGQLAYLAFVAMVRLRPARTLLAIDEPELHLHPGLLTRVTQFLAASSEAQPVLLATHSDHLLDVLSDPAESVRVCELVHGRTCVRSLDANQLTLWLAEYRGLGALRADGFLAHVVKMDDPS